MDRPRCDRRVGQPTIDLAAAKRLMLRGTSDLDVSIRRTIAAGRWAEGPSGWQCAAPGGRQGRWKRLVPARDGTDQPVRSQRERRPMLSRTPGGFPPDPISAAFARALQDMRGAHTPEMRREPQQPP